MKKKFIIPFVALAVAFSSCGGGGSQEEGSDSTTETTEEVAETPAAAETVPGVEDLEISNTLALEGNDQMKFDKDLFRVKAGEEITLTFTNVGELPKESMGHNVVILKPGVDVPTFGNEAVAASDNDYIPVTSMSSIIAHTKLLGPGEQDEITFTLDAPGVYTYICSFPGHFGSMKGEIYAE